MSFNAALLDILVCPVTRLPLEVISPATLERLNARVDESRVRNRGDSVLSERLQGALVTRDGKVAYPIRDGIPVLLENEGIELVQLDR